MVEMESSLAFSSPVAFVLLVIVAATHVLVTSNLFKDALRASPVYFGRLTKRILFNNRIGTLEIVFAFLVTVDFSRSTYDDCECRGRPNSFVADYFLYLIVGVSCLSLSRCLLQVVGVSGLSRSDVASMTRVYLVPFTCIVSGLCVFSWFGVLEFPIPEYQCDFVSWYSGDRRCILGVFLALFFLSLVHDFLEFRRQSASVTPVNFRYLASPIHSPLQWSEQVFADEDIFYEIPGNGTTFKKLGKQTNFSETPKSALQDLPITISVDHTTALNLSLGSSQLPKDVASNGRHSYRSQSSVCRFLRQIARLNLTLLIYLVILIGAYVYTECLFSYLPLRSYQSAVFTALLSATAVLRVIQISVFHSLFRQKVASGHFTNV